MTEILRPIWTWILLSENVETLINNSVIFLMIEKKKWLFVCYISGSQMDTEIALFSANCRWTGLNEILIQDVVAKTAY